MLIEMDEKDMEELNKYGFFLNEIKKEGQHPPLYCLSKFKSPDMNWAYTIRKSFFAIGEQNAKQLTKEFVLYMKLYNFSMANGWDGKKNIKPPLYIIYNVNNIFRCVQTSTQFHATDIAFISEEIGLEAIRLYKKELEDVFGIKHERRVCERTPSVVPED